jgi:hypothetical protein
MNHYNLKPQDPIPAEVTPEQLASWYQEKTEFLQKLKKVKANISVNSRYYGCAHYFIQRYEHELKKIREAAAARPYAITGPDLSSLHISLSQ